MKKSILLIVILCSGCAGNPSMGQWQPTPEQQAQQRCFGASLLANGGGLQNQALGQAALASGACGNYQRPQQTHCVPNIYGAMDCSTQ